MGGDVLGTMDEELSGFPDGSPQALAVLKVANTASQSELVDGAGLPSATAERCVELADDPRGTLHGLWNDTTCETPKPYVCRL